ncbi:hypothetical protein [Brevibacterium album]|uniref:hypothetical protein n=1 Tax=Brevibacterium album TaxID=417948 RepID=UPI0003F96DFB|nr:hypothetical protein [Brevibacterium album]
MCAIAEAALLALLACLLCLAAGAAVLFALLVRRRRRRAAEEREAAIASAGQEPRPSGERSFGFFGAMTSTISIVPQLDGRPRRPTVRRQEGERD